MPERTGSQRAIQTQWPYKDTLAVAKHRDVHSQADSLRPKRQSTQKQIKPYNQIHLKEGSSSHLQQEGGRFELVSASQSTGLQAQGAVDASKMVKGPKGSFERVHFRNVELKMGSKPVAEKFGLGLKSVFDRDASNYLGGKYASLNTRYQSLST